MTRDHLLSPELAALLDTLRRRLDAASLARGEVQAAAEHAAYLAGLCEIALHAAAEALSAMAAQAASLVRAAKPAPLPPQPQPPMRMFCARMPDVETKP